jgi:hypothetical protein
MGYFLPRWVIRAEAIKPTEVENAHSPWYTQCFVLQTIGNARGIFVYATTKGFTYLVNNWNMKTRAS